MHYRVHDFCQHAGRIQKDLNTELIGLSIDSIFSPIAWLKRIEEKIEYKGMKKVEIKFPVIADLKMEVVKKYGMVQQKGSRTQTARSTFVIGPESKIRAIIHYPVPNGRNIKELKRLISAMQKVY